KVLYIDSPYDQGIFTEKLQETYPGKSYEELLIMQTVEVIRFLKDCGVDSKSKLALMNPRSAFKKKFGEEPPAVMTVEEFFKWYDRVGKAEGTEDNRLASNGGVSSGEFLDTEKIASFFRRTATRLYSFPNYARNKITGFGKGYNFNPPLLEPDKKEEMLDLLDRMNIHVKQQLSARLDSFWNKDMESKDVKADDFRKIVIKGYDEKEVFLVTAINERGLASDFLIIARKDDEGYTVEDVAIRSTSFSFNEDRDRNTGDFISVPEDYFGIVAKTFEDALNINKDKNIQSVDKYKVFRPFTRKEYENALGHSRFANMVNKAINASQHLKEIIGFKGHYSIDLISESEETSAHYFSLWEAMHVALGADIQEERDVSAVIAHEFLHWMIAKKDEFLTITPAMIKYFKSRHTIYWFYNKFSKRAKTDEKIAEEILGDFVYMSIYRGDEFEEAAHRRLHKKDLEYLYSLGIIEKLSVPTRTLPSRRTRSLVKEDRSTPSKNLFVWLKKKTLTILHSRRSHWLKDSTKKRDSELELLSIEEKVRETVKHYELGITSIDGASVTELTGSIPNRKPLRIQTEKGDFVLKYAADSSKKAKFVTSLIQKAYSTGIPVPRSHLTKSGERYIQIKDRFYYLEDYIDGEVLIFDEASPRHFASLGRLMALVHNRLSRFKPQGKKQELLSIDVVNAEEDFLRLRKDLTFQDQPYSRADKLFLENVGFIIGHLFSLKRHLPFSKYRKLPSGIIHGDLGIINTKWQKDAVFVLFDWERSRSGQARIEEFKNALLARGPNNGRRYKRENILALLKTYQLNQIHKLTPEELTALPYILGPGTFLWDMANWFILRRQDLNNSDELYEMTQGLIQEFHNIVDDFNGEWWPEEKNKLLGNNIRGILKERETRQTRLVQELQDTDTLDVELALMHLSLKSTYKDPEINSVLSDQERSALLAKALAISLRRKDGSDIAQFLEIFLNEQSNLILPEAKMFIRSYLAVFNISTPLKIAVCTSLYGGQERYPDVPIGRGWFRTKADQFFRELLSVNPNVRGMYVFVNDGDDSTESKSGKKTCEVLNSLLEDEDYADVRDKISVLELSQEDKKRMNSVKHGALACAMRFAMDKGADIVVYTDGDLSAHLGLSGLLVDPLVNKGKGCAFGSIRKKGAIVPYRGVIRNSGSVVYNWWVRLLHRPIVGIKDTQRSFKAFKKEVLEDILPVKIQSIDEGGGLKIEFDPDFLYDFTGDTEWLARTSLSGYSLEEIPIIWIPAPETSMIRLKRYAFPMFISVARQRRTLARFKIASSVAATILSMIMGVFLFMGIFVGKPLRSFIPRETTKVSVPVSPEIKAQHKEINQLVKELGYSDEVAKGLIEMIKEWENPQGRPIVSMWKERLAGIREEHKQGNITKEQLAELEGIVIKAVSARIQKEIGSNEEFFDLVDIVKHRQTQCLGYSQLVYILGSYIGFSVKPVNVLEFLTLRPLRAEIGHIACIVELADNKVVMIDLAQRPYPMLSNAFDLRKEFEKVGDYWVLKDENNPLGIYKRIQLLDKDGLQVDIHAYFKLGAIYAESGEFDKAIVLFTKIVNELDPRHVDAHYNLGLVYSHKDQFKEAVFYLKKVIEDLDPEYTNAYYALGIIHARVARYPEAIDWFTKVIKLKPDYALAHFYRGAIYASLGKLKEAKRDLLKAVKLDPDLKSEVEKILKELNIKLDDTSQFPALALLIFGSIFRQAGRKGDGSLPPSTNGEVAPPAAPSNETETKLVFIIKAILEPMVVKVQERVYS
ncbi:MAG: tetratricopeptide repeat protein, partial [Candidatus Omnitrophica bacterium]|nr:tetratricopeptide repeat protein [Candidatus Omnitrophota bacterium]